MIYRINQLTLEDIFDMIGMKNPWSNTQCCSIRGRAYELIEINGTHPLFLAVKATLKQRNQIRH